MKTPILSPHPPNCGDRCLFLVYLGSVVFALALLSALVGGYDPRLALSAAAASAAALLLHLYLHTTGLLAACAEEDDRPVHCHLELMAGDPRKR
jgi:hypothetical protein